MSISPLANPVQADALERILPLVPPPRRLLVAAAFIGCSPMDFCEAAGFTPRMRYYYLKGGKKGMPVWVLWHVAEAVGVSFSTLWDDEALQAPWIVLTVGSQSLNRRKAS